MAEQTKILVVEDESVVALDHQVTLERLGYTVVGLAGTGREAVEKALVTNPDLVLMDIRMPGEIDGIQAAKRIRSQNDIPVVYVTAYGDEKTLARAQVTEPYGYLLKPFTERDLRVTIEVARTMHSLKMGLEQKVRELTALNTLFQRHLLERERALKAYDKLVSGVHQRWDEVMKDLERTRQEIAPAGDDAPAHSHR